MYEPLTPSTSPPWSRTTKSVVAIVAILLIAAVAFRFQTLIGQLVVAAMLAYILNPLIILLDERAPMKRGLAILIIYLLLALLVIGGFVALGVAAYGQTLNFIGQAPQLIDQLIAFIEEWTQRPEPIFSLGPIELRPTTVNWDAVRAQVLGLIDPLVSRGSQLISALAQSTIRTIGYILFVFVISVYVAIEIPQLGGYVGRAAQQPGYRQDAERIMREFRRIWSAYLRGQVILGLIIGLVVWLGLTLLGVQNALALGLLSGLLEFVPIIGPVIGGGVAIIVAFFQPENYLGLTPLQHALVVLVLMTLIQQLENNILVPRIVGEALDLHPLLVMIGVFMGGSIAGILGAILAAPIVATIKLLGLYAWRKMFDLPPFPKDEPVTRTPGPTIWQRGRSLIGRLL